MNLWIWIPAAVVVAALIAVTLYDVFQRKHAILRNFPIIGHFRYLLEMVGPELRQYIVTDNDAERPFSRDQRRWVYSSSKKQNNYFGFGTDNDLELTPNYLIIKHHAFPLSSHGASSCMPCAKVMGAHRNRKKAFRPASAVYVSGMSYGSLGKAAVEAIGGGCKLADCLQNTGEGGLSQFHIDSGADLMLQLGTAYFGARDAKGRFSMTQLKETVARCPRIRAIEIKLSQGAKPGLGGHLPKEKITKEISEARGIPMGEDCISPAGHSAFSCADSMLDFVESIAGETGLPVGIKSAVGEMTFWKELAQLMTDTKRGVDFIAIDGGEGGTGAAPLAFSDHVALPFKLGFTRVQRIFQHHNLHQQIVFVGAGRLGFPADALFAFALGCDMIAVAREAMLSIGCIQAQLCHTGHCPAGVATHQPWLMRGLDPTLKAARLANYVAALRLELLKLSHTCGVEHPAFVTTGDFEILDGQLGSSTIEEVFHLNGHGVPSEEDSAELRRLMAEG